MDADFDDASSNALTVTANGSAAISAARSAFGGGSLSCPTSGSHLSIAATPLLEFGSADFTIEGWFYKAIGSGDVTLAAQWGGSDYAWFFGSSSFYMNNAQVCGFTALPEGQWLHCAACRSGEKVWVFVNGILVGSGYVGSASVNISNAFIGIGDDQLGNPDFLGYIDEFRITIGVARYTTNFTPPTAQLTVYP
jgi:hypothetical protein